MKSNFSFLKAEWTSLAKDALQAEKYVFSDPKASAMYARNVLENLLRWLYETDSSLDLPKKEQPNINDLLHEYSFKNSYGIQFGKELHLIRKVGNTAAHTSSHIPITPEESLACVKYLFRFSLFIVRTFAEYPPEAQSFDESLIPTSSDSLLQKELEQLKAQVLAAAQELERSKIIQTEQEDELQQLREKQLKYEERRQHNGQVAAPQVLSEAQTRDLYINLLLKEAAWNPLAARTSEFAIHAVDDETGEIKLLKADYVLWGDDGKPLAVVEAKRTRVQVEKGRGQAIRYADALQKEYGQRPLIYYTNGFDTYFLDDLRYPPRKVYGFHKKEEMQRAIFRRTQQKSLHEIPVNQTIANRYYQKRAIKRVSERFEDENQRRALLVMATGTGKTRVSAAIVDVLSKANWAKRILFLADRNALVTQAKEDFNKNLPSLTSIDLTKDDDLGEARIVFSTYQTILNRIDTDYENGQRLYGIGHFDLVVIDEAHRSIYDKYGSLFEYFDALYLGLTATPKDETDRDTYAIFHCESSQPTDAYEYATAVADGFLVPIKKVELGLKFPTSGIRYAELTAEEKEEYERKFRDPLTGEIPDQVDGRAINSWLFNTDTVDKVWEALLTHGKYVEGGEKIGKTIVFARNHRHAEFLKERFDTRYPQFQKGSQPGQFAEVIDNYNSESENLIKNFKNKDRRPQIAISVDMLDTGIDVPEVVNLVFFKPVYSASKFWQMLGRGTRLCRDLYGPDDDKKDFYVFDVCQVFDFFDQNPEGIKPSRTVSLSEKLFTSRTELVYLLQQSRPTHEDATLAARVIDSYLHRQTSNLDPQRFEVQMHWRAVETFNQRDAWNGLREKDIREVTEHIAPLVHDQQSHELTKRFDLLMLSLQLATLRSDPTRLRYINRVQDIARDFVENKSNVPLVAAHLSSIKAVLQPEFWHEVSITSLEQIREEWRELMVLLGSEKQELVFTSFQDELMTDIEVKEFRGSYGNLESHYAKLRRIILENSDHLTIRKLHKGLPITQAELAELDRMLFEGAGFDSRTAFEKELGNQPLGLFVRSIVGLDRSAAKEAFSVFLQNGPLTSTQMNFINELIDLLTQQGSVHPRLLFEAPFTHYHQDGVQGVFQEKSSLLIEKLKRINEFSNVS
ncbi:hypothetical protein BWI93_17010 [Siphonobacter sp. BAB-5385]|uniref:DEAD/DEAH box helicase family protein n=1 Tax=Siphonobacter sp. BAB-5385 TaxID=1864822 RepID=UPI000B9E94DC|nr:DEAD/DEAH box helicase family protein [Siphonobacter sp. BAB-5385]OZI07006.1 hypothetical protein BWI93_17010 [Siphonobacter sp. BAB-5385]